MAANDMMSDLEKLLHKSKEPDPEPAASDNTGKARARSRSRDRGGDRDRYMRPAVFSWLVLDVCG
jgi:hypothetical protein